MLVISISTNQNQNALLLRSTVTRLQSSLHNAATCSDVSSSRDDWLVVNLSTRLFHVKHSVKKWMRSFRGQSAEVSENVLQINELQFAGTRAGRRICRRHP